MTISQYGKADLEPVSAATKQEKTLETGVYRQNLLLCSMSFVSQPAVEERLSPSWITPFLQ
ncbi:MAG: hypothetical protein SFY66_13950 [Oculatellaceae cyanobacterium bins.114]|nr:hypothetical protein [Oculatellaceae cyanobacterium bins.114]